MSRGPAHRGPHRALEQLPPRDIDRLTVLAASVPHDVSTGTLDPHVPLPRGWRRFSRSAVLDRTDLDALERELLSWAVQLRSGLQVAASDAPLRPGTWFTRLGAPLLDVLQDRMTDRYLRALGTAAPGDPSIGLR